ncbi:MAG: polysulfide reductase NrfD [Gemmatimonadota bacterium]|nr:polysulfide reductase NrfD [Gemmatimonadota bacterium]
MSKIALLQQIANHPAFSVGLPPRWGWYVILYFFLGGIAAGSYFVATMLQMLGDERDDEVVRLGYRIAFPLVVACGILLVLDLGKPFRFWHMIFQSERFPVLMMKPWSAISVGTWVILIFSFFSFVSWVGTLVASGRLTNARLVALDRWARTRPSPIAVAWGIAGAFFGFFLAGYTGVLVSGASLAAWHGARLLGALFLVSAASTSYALLMLLLMRRGPGRLSSTVEKLGRADRWAIVIEIIVIAVTLAMLGDAGRPFVSGGFGVLFWIGVVIVGLVAPLVLHWRAPNRAALAATCVLVGGFLLRVIIVMAPQWPHISAWRL